MRKEHSGEQTVQ